MVKIQFISPSAESAFQKFKDKESNRKPFVSLENNGFKIYPVETKPIEGYKAPKNFPNCCSNHKQLYKEVLEWYEQFPNCCEGHKNLITAKWFDKTKYKQVPLQVLKKLSFTEYHIKTRINIPYWFKDITDYIEYTVISLGQLPAGFGGVLGKNYYLNPLKQFLKQADLPKDKAAKLIELIDNEYYAPANATKSNLNILYSIYQKWIKIFPFGISLFNEFKKEIENSFPIAYGEPHHNKYLNAVGYKIYSDLELIKSLINTTKILLQKLDTQDLLERKIINGLKAYTLEVMNEKHRIKQFALLNKFSKGEKQYIKIVKKWLSNEKEYLNEVASLLINPEESGNTNLKEGNQNQDYRKNHKDLHAEKQVKSSVPPTFKKEFVPVIFDLLKDFFKTEQQTLLEKLLQTGEKPNEKLLFLGYGKTLLDTFKQLIEGKFLIIGLKKDCEQWISRTFMYMHNNKPTAFTPEYASTIISQNARAALGKRLINVVEENGKFIITPCKLLNREQNKK